MQPYQLPLILTFASAVALMFTITTIMLRYYMRTTPDSAIVRSGVGGPTVAIDRGLLVLPFLHSHSRVYTGEHTVALSFDKEDGVFSADNQLIELSTELQLRVPKDAASILASASTLADRTYSTEALAAHVRPKLQQALRSLISGIAADNLASTGYELDTHLLADLTPLLEPAGLKLEAVSSRLSIS